MPVPNYGKSVSALGRLSLYKFNFTPNVSRAETRIISNYLRVSYPGILQSMIKARLFYFMQLTERTRVRCLVSNY